MKAGKRIAALVLAGVMVFGNATPAMAANVKDASFKFSAGTKYTHHGFGKLEFSN